MRFCLCWRSSFSSNARKLVFSLTITSLILLVICTILPTIQASSDDWPMFHHDLQHSGFSASTAPNKNVTLWDYGTGGSVDSCPAVVDGEVYVGSGDNKTFCLDAFTGTLVWNFTTDYYIISSPAVADGRVYVGSADRKVYCLNASTGAQVWNYATGGPILSKPVVTDGKLYVGSDDDKLYCLDASTGVLIWNYTGRSEISCSPAVADGSIWFGSQDNVYCLNALTGAQIWNYTTGAAVFSSPAFANGDIYVGSDDNKVYCLNGLTGNLIWNFTAANWIESSPAIAYGNIFVGSGDGKVYCLNASTGVQVWNYTTGGPLISSPAIADDKLYVGCENDVFYCLNATTGAYIWSYATDGQIDSSPAVAYGNVYVGSDDQKVYCFGLADTTPPTITDLSQTPSAGSVSPQDTVQVNATVTDNASGVKEVTLSYANNSGAWTNTTMSNLEGNVWNATIPAFPDGTNVTYIITAEDNANNNVTTLALGYNLQYRVVPEFATLTTTLLLFMSCTLVAVALHKRNQFKHRNWVGSPVRKNGLSGETARASDNEGVAVSDHHCSGLYGSHSVG